jgi:hypothetical protein
MANANSTAFVKKSTELHVEEYEWGKYYRGTEAAFIASGLIKPGWFPGKPGNPKSSCHIGMLDGEIKILPYKSMENRLREELTTIKLWKVGKRFAAYIDWPKGEKERRSRMKEIEKAHQAKANGIACIPADHKEYVQKQVHSLTCRMSVMRTNLTRGFGYSGGYYFSAELVAEFDIVADHLVQLLQEEPVHFNKGTRRREIAKIESEFIDKNPEFSAFMATTLAIGKASAVQELGGDHG